MNYYKRHVGDYAVDCGHLSMVEDGAYNRILDAYYKREHGPTLADAFKWGRARTDEEREAVRFVLAEFFTLDGERYVQSRVESELARYHARAEINRKVGKLGGRPRKQTQPDPIAKRMGSKENPNHEPLTTNQQPVTIEARQRAARVAPAPKKTGMRLPQNWMPDEHLMREAMAINPTANLQREIDSFRDYWHSKATNATKLDWSATFRNWMRKTDNEHPRSAVARVQRNILTARAQRAIAGEPD